MYVRPLRSDELYHHGILGMHWGIRRYQPYPSGYRGKGKEVGEAAKTGKQQPNNQNESLSKTEKAVKQKAESSVSKALTQCKKSYISTQALAYRKKNHGMTVKESRELSEKKLNLMKKVAIGAAVVGAGVLAVGVSRYVGRNYINPVIKAGVSIQTLSHDSERMKKGQAFFTAYKGLDKVIYEHNFGGNYEAGRGKFKNQADVIEDIRVAGRKAAQKVYENLRKTDPEFAKLAEQIDTRREGIMRIGSAKRKLAYDRFNYFSLGTGDDLDLTKKANEIFFKALKDNGFGAVLDVNDVKYSALRGDSPVILFDRSKLDNLRDAGRVTYEEMVAKNWGVSKEQIGKFGIEYHHFMDNIAKNPALYAAYVTGFGSIYGMGTVGEMYDMKVGSNHRKKLREKANKKKK